MNDFDFLLAEVMKEARAVGVPISNKINSMVVVNSRAKSRFGRCISDGKGYTIELSDRLKNAPEISCRQTIAHELIHTCKGCMNHGSLFKLYADRMNQAYGYHISRTNSCEEMGVDAPGNYAKYVIICEKCGCEIKRNRRSSLVDAPSRYRCKCGGTLKLKGAESYVENNTTMTAKYVLLCLKCGKRIERARMSNAVRSPSKYRCMCGGALKRIK